MPGPVHVELPYDHHAAKKQNRQEQQKKPVLAKESHRAPLSQAGCGGRNGKRNQWTDRFVYGKRIFSRASGRIFALKLE